MAVVRGRLRHAVSRSSAFQRRSVVHLVQQRVAHRFRQTLPERRRATGSAAFRRARSRPGRIDQWQPAAATSARVRSVHANRVPGAASQVRVATASVVGDSLLFHPYQVPSAPREATQRRVGGGDQIQLHGCQRNELC